LIRIVQAVAVTIEVVGTVLGRTADR
jgi:hypothetical protein